ncbi:MAG TPA: amidohydrolase family protein [Candidatus Limnocylindrales bacterium]|nr:amidohydrolase family protein [Candidatus Limnocylindrales bacterium]
MSVVIRGGLVMPMVDGARATPADVVVSASRISVIAPDAAAPADAEVLDRPGHYVLPGLIQTHVHLVQTIFRGLAEDLTLLDWLRRRVWPLEAAHTDETVRASLRLGLCELLLSGTTTVLDMGTTKLGDAQAEELIRSGIRAFFGQAMMDTGEGAPADLLETTRASLDASAGLMKQWHRSANGRVRYAYSPRFALSCTSDLLEAVAALAKINDLLIHTHSNEDPTERAAIEAVTGRSPVAYLVEAGIASERAVAAHGVHVDDNELAMLRETNMSVAHCPTSNLKLGAGIADVRRLHGARVAVGLGSDGGACNNSLDTFEEARMASLLARSLHGQGAITAESALLMATRDGARVLHMDAEIGTLEVGKRADIVVLDPERLDHGGDPATRIVFGRGGRAVRDVLVDGTVLVRDRVALTLDPVEVRAKGAEAQAALLARASLS